jgi:hypothetical protein
VKLNKKSAVHFSLAILCVSLTGCSDSVQVEPLGNGYEEVTYTRTSWEPESHQISLQYQTAGGKRVMIWPSLDGVRPIMKDDIMVFVGTKAYEPPDPDEPRATKQRLFVVKAPDLPLDITDEVLWRCAKQPGPQLYATLESPLADGSWPKWVKQSDTNLVEDIKNPHMSIDLLEETNGALKFCGPYFDFHLDWNLVPDVIREVKEKGVVRKDRVWHTTYIEKEFKLEVQK